MNEFARGEWERAQRTLASGRQLADTDPDSAASRAYYAAFHAVTALFALRGQTFSRHGFLRAAVHRDFVRPGLWATDLGRDYDLLMDLRETADYGGLAHVSQDSAIRALDKAAGILHAVKQTCPELADKPR